MIAGLLLALGGTGTMGPVVPADTARQTVTLGWDAGTKSCTARVGTLEIGDPATDDGEAALAGALSDRQSAVQLQGLDGVPYDCVDTVVSALRKSGHSVKVGFLSEPPSR